MIWKNIPGFEGSYQVSDTGDVKSLARVVEKSDGTTMKVHARILTPVWTGRAYIVTPTLYGKGTCSTVASLVCLAFHGERPHPSAFPGYKDENKRNIRASNLEWRIPKCAQ